MKTFFSKTNLFLGAILLASFFMRYVLLSSTNSEDFSVSIGTIILILILGSFVIYNSARFIEDITAVLKNKTGLGGGLLQALGTAFSDMVLGITAAFLSLQAAASGSSDAVNYALIAASTTFGSNIFNIAYAAWAMGRQNLANKKHKDYKVFPLFGGGDVTPMHKHAVTPNLKEMDMALNVLASLSALTAIVALGMVFWGKVTPPKGITGDLYQLKREAGIVILFVVFAIIFFFRKDYGTQQEEEHNPFLGKSNFVIWASLIVTAIAILFTAESMVHAISRLSDITHIPVMLTGMLTGFIGCLGEMMVIHNYVVHPKGRIGEAIIGVAMDNIITILGASIIAIMGGIFLGSDSLIIIFVLILLLNSFLIWQVAEIKNEYIRHKNLAK